MTADLIYIMKDGPQCEACSGHFWQDGPHLQFCCLLFICRKCHLKYCIDHVCPACKSERDLSKYVTVQHVQKKLEFDLDYEEKEEEKKGLWKIACDVHTEDRVNRYDLDTKKFYCKQCTDCQLKSKVSIVPFDGSCIERMCKKLLEILYRMTERISENNLGDPLSDKLREINNFAKEKWYVFND
jgi:hypothetical protein